MATLLQVYEDHTGEKGQEQIIGGGTYGRLLKRGVAYGAMFPGYTDTMHQANEFMELDDLLATSDVVCVMAPLTDETYHMCDEAFFKKAVFDFRKQLFLQFLPFKNPKSEPSIY